MSSTLRFVIIGCGRIAHRHAEQIRRVGELVAVCDIVPETARDFSQKYACRFYDKLEDLLIEKKELANWAVICTPNGLHAEQSILCLQNGWNVLCEKPMALNSKDAKKMIEEAEKADRKLLVVKQNRYNPPVAFTKRLLKENKLGKILSIQLNGFWHRDANYYQSPWKGTKKMDGGILFTQFSHFIDIVYWLVGDIQKIISLRKNLLLGNKIEFEDNCVVIAEFENGALGTMHFTINSYQKNMEGSITIFGEKGTVKIGGQYLNKLEYLSMDDSVENNIPTLTEKNKANDYGFYQGSMSNHDKIYDALQNLVNGHITDESLLANAYDGYKTIEIIEKIYEAAGEIY